MRLDLTLHPRKIAIVLGCVAVLLAAQSLFAEYVVINLIGETADNAPARLLDVFSVNRESSIPTWYSMVNLLLCACLLAWIARIKRMSRARDRGYWLGLAVIFLYLSVDEGAAIHEATSGPLKSAFNAGGFFEFGWLIVGIPLVLLFGVAYFRFWLRLEPRTRWLFALAGLMYVGGGVVVEGISANQYATDGGASFTYLTIATVEELLEMLGVVVFLYALLDYLARGEQAAELMARYDLSLEPTAGAWRRYAVWRTALTFGAGLALLNGGLMIWGVALGDGSGSAAPYHFYVLVDELAGQDVTISHFSGAFNPADTHSHRSARALLSDFAEVQILALPALNASIALAGDRPTLDRESVVELMQWIRETDYVFYDTPIVRLIVGQ